MAPHAPPLDLPLLIINISAAFTFNSSKIDVEFLYQQLWFLKLMLYSLLCIVKMNDKRAHSEKNVKLSVLLLSS